MKIGFSSLVCPGWDLDTIIRRAAEMGFDGVELRGGLCGQMDLPRVRELADDPGQVRRRFNEANIELVCLGTSAHLDSCLERELSEEKAVITESIELAARLGCPCVRIFVGEIQQLDNERFALSRIAEQVASMVPVAARHNVTVLVENGGDFPGSDALWFIIDAARHPAVQACWNQSHALTVRERPTISIPRLNSRIGMVHVSDAEFDERGTLLEYRLPGRGHADVAKQIELLKGVLYDGYLVFEWPKAAVETLPEPDTALPEVATFLRQCLDAEQEVLTAYKGDKRKVNLASPSTVDGSG